MISPNDRQRWMLWRKTKKITLEQISNAIGSSKASLSRYENSESDLQIELIKEYQEFIVNFKSDVPNFE